MTTTPRALAALGSSFASLAVSVGLGVSALRSAFTSDSQLLASYRGATYSDVFGFGLWPTLGVVALLQFALLLLAWRLFPHSLRRIVVPTLLAAFAIAVFLEYSSFGREHSLWLKQ